MIVDDIKRDLRIKSNSLDGEIESLIEAAKSDMYIAGINTDVITDTGDIDPLIYTAIKLYCKGNFGYDDKSEVFREAYDNMKLALSCAGKYQDMGSSE